MQPLPVHQNSFYLPINPCNGKQMEESMLFCVCVSINLSIIQICLFFVMRLLILFCRTTNSFKKVSKCTTYFYSFLQVLHSFFHKSFLLASQQCQLFCINPIFLAFVSGVEIPSMLRICMQVFICFLERSD